MADQDQDTEPSEASEDNQASKNKVAALKKFKISNDIVMALLGAVVTGIFGIIIAIITFEGKIASAKIEIKDEYRSTATAEARLFEEGRGVLLSEKQNELSQTATALAGEYNQKLSTLEFDLQQEFEATAAALTCENDTTLNPDLLVNADLWKADKWTNGVAPVSLPVDIQSEDINGEQVKTLALKEDFIFLSQQIHEGNAQGWSKPIDALSLTWSNPMQQIPLGGIVAQIFFDPSSDDPRDRLFCEFNMLYNLGDHTGPYTYTSQDHYIAPDQWNTIAWDFSGDYYTENVQWSDILPTPIPAGHSFLNLSSGLGERVLYDAVVANNPTWYERVRSIGLFCFVTASTDFVGAVDQTDLQGKLKLGRVWALPVEYPTLHQP